MDNKAAVYANAVSTVLNNDTGETVISFLQVQPGYNQNTKKMDIPTEIEVASIIIPVSLTEKIPMLFSQLIDGYNAHQETKNKAE